MLRSVNVSRTEPAIEPVSTDEVAEYLRIDYDDHDTMIAGYSKEARQTIEDGYLWKALITQTCVDKFDAFGELELHWQPVQSITSISYLDADGSTQTLATSVYEIGKERGVSYVRLKYGQQWPSTYAHQDVITITYVVGYGDASTNVPEAIRQAIIMYAGHLYDNPTEPPPWWVQQRLAPYIDTRCVG